MNFISGPTDEEPDVGRPMNLDDVERGDGFVSAGGGTFGADLSDPDVGRVVNPDDYGRSGDFEDNPVLRREVRMPSRRDMIQRRSALPKFFRGPGGPDRAEGERQSPIDIELEGTVFLYAKKVSTDGWTGYDDQGRVAHGNVAVGNWLLDTSTIGA